MPIADASIAFRDAQQRLSCLLSGVSEQAPDNGQGDGHVLRIALYPE